MFHPSRLLRGCNLPETPAASALTTLCAPKAWDASCSKGSGIAGAERPLGSASHALGLQPVRNPATLRRIDRKPHAEAYD